MVSEKEKEQLLPISEPSHVRDEVLDWKIVDRTTLEVSKGMLMSPNLPYKLVVIDTKKNSKDPNDADFSATIGRVNPSTFTDTTHFTGLIPLRTYHIGFCEEDLWHWNLIEVPVAVVPYQVWDRGLTIHIDIDQNPAVVGLRIKVHCGGFVSERDYEIDMMEISEDTGLQCVSLRNLSPSTGYNVTCWPIMEGQVVGNPSLPIKMCTFQPATLSTEEIGDTFLRLSFRRPLWMGPLSRNVTEKDARIAEYRLRIWEDPTETLMKNAERLSAGRMAQKYPLQRREFTGQDIATGATFPIVVSKLKPDAIHFVTLETRTDTVEWDHPVRIRVRTASELEIVDKVVLSPTSIFLSWTCPLATTLDGYNLDVRYPPQVNMFDDRDEEFPYIGNATKILPEGMAWSPPVSLDGTEGTSLLKAELQELEGQIHKGNASILPRCENFQIEFHNLHSGKRSIQRCKLGGMFFDRLEPASAYSFRIRTDQEFKSATMKPREAAPWSVPYVFVTPSRMMCREVHRTSNSITCGIGRFKPPSLMPMAGDGGYKSYLPHCDIPNQKTAPFYYYLEPLPFVCIDHESPPELSDSEEEDDVYDDHDDQNGSSQTYYGRKLLIRNRQPRPEALFDLPIEVIDESVEKIVVLVIEGDASDSGLSALCRTNHYCIDLPAAYKEKFENLGRTVTIFETDSDSALQTFDSLKSNQAYSVLCFSVHTQRDESDDTTYQVFSLLDQFSVETLSSTATIATGLGSVGRIFDCSGSGLWGDWLAAEVREKAKLSQKGILRTTESKLRVVEISEVFVTLFIDTPDHSDNSTTLLNTLLLSPVEEEELPIAREFLLEVKQFEGEEGGKRQIGGAMYVYYCTGKPQIQLLNLHAATMYEVRVSTIDTLTHAWQGWSDALAFTTVQKLLLEVQEMSSEYLRLKWGRSSSTDNIKDYQLRFYDLGSDFDSKPLGSMNLVPESNSNESLGELAVMMGTVSQSLLDSGRMAKEIITSTTTHRTSILGELRHNSVFDCNVSPHYTNGQVGLPSNPIRFTHCLLNAQVVECGVSHLFVEWDAINFVKLCPSCMQETTKDIDKRSMGTILLRLRGGDDWERTVEVEPTATSHIFANLTPLTQFTLNASYMAVLPTCGCCAPPDPREVLNCTTPFNTKGTTLAQPTAQVKKLGESCVELVWQFHSERDHEGDITMELQFLDKRKAEDFQLLATCSTTKGTTTGQGSATVEGLLPERLYLVRMRQQYNRGTWGEWQKVLDGVSTLRRIEVNINHIGDSFFDLFAFRQAWTLGQGTHESMSSAEQINPPLWRFSVEHMGTHNIVHKEVKEPTGIIPGLEPNTPYALSVQQWSINDWGEASLKMYMYTLQSMVPIVLVRSDNYLKIGCARDKRLPTVGSQHCKAHDEQSAAKYSSLMAVEFSATSLLDRSVPPNIVELTGDEETAVAGVGLLTHLKDAHPYRIDLTCRYKQDKSDEEGISVLVTSLATITQPVPDISVAGLSESTVSVMSHASKASITHFSTFSNLPENVRHAARDGSVATITAWQVRTQPFLPGDDDTTKTISPIRRKSSLVRKPVVRTGYFQDPNIEEKILLIEDSGTLNTMDGLLPETSYSLSLRSVDNHGHTGSFIACGRVKTRRFTDVKVEKIAENFVELAWDAEHLGVTPSVSPRIGHRRLPKGGGSASSPSNSPSQTALTKKEEPHQSHKLELLVLNLTASPEEVFGNVQTTIVDFSVGRVLIESLTPRAPYCVIARTHQVLKGGEVVKGSWGPQIQFKTLDLLVLRVVHVSLNFVNVSWKSQEEVSLVQDGNSYRVPEAEFPPTILDSSTFFCTDSQSSKAGILAAAVRFQLRVMYVDKEDYSVGDLKEDMFVADGNIHTIANLEPETPYAISMRVCYEGISGTWVVPAVIVTDHIPDVKVLEVTQNSGEFSFVVSQVENQPRVVEPVPERRHRLYEVIVEDEPDRGPQYVMVNGGEPAVLRVERLKRDQLYRCLIREVVNGIVFSKSYSLATSFWTQPYPPIVTELSENRDNYAEIRWGIMSSERVGEVLTNDRVPHGFVYSFERGIRYNVDMAKDWEEIAITDTPKVRFQWKDPKDTHTSFSKFCFRVRLSKMFVVEEGKNYKVPVWGDYSQIAYWKNTEPPGLVDHLQVAYLSENFAIVKWKLPEGWTHHPQLQFSASIDPSRAQGTEMVPEWFSIGTTSNLHIRVDHLRPGATYKVAIRCESTFGTSPTPSIISLTTRTIPNTDPIPSLPKMTSEQLSKVSGLASDNAKKHTSSNLHDKYEKPKQRRLKALSALAGIKTVNKRTNLLMGKIKTAARKAIMVKRELHNRAVRAMMEEDFFPNAELSAMQEARRSLGMNPFDDDIVWNDRLFRLHSVCDDFESADMAIASTFGKMARTKEGKGSKHLGTSAKPTPYASAKPSPRIREADADISWKSDSPVQTPSKRHNELDPLDVCTPKNQNGKEPSNNPAIEEQSGVTLPEVSTVTSFSVNTTTFSPSKNSVVSISDPPSRPSRRTSTESDSFASVVTDVMSHSRSFKRSNSVSGISRRSSVSQIGTKRGSFAATTGGFERTRSFSHTGNSLLSNSSFGSRSFHRKDPSAVRGLVEGEKVAVDPPPQLPPLLQKKLNAAKNRKQTE